MKEWLWDCKDKFEKHDLSMPFQCDIHVSIDAAFVAAAILADVYAAVESKTIMLLRCVSHLWFKKRSDILDG